ncbi:MAG: IS1595 family transposase [Candidatus Dormibacter sp.]
MEFPKTLVSAVRYFADEDVSNQFLAKLRWPNGAVCPREGCGTPNPYYVKTRRIWRCKGCKRQFSVKVGTIFEDSPIALSDWLVAMWMHSSSKKGVSSYHLARALGVTQKTAWFMGHRIRLAMKTQLFAAPLSGEVEADETYVGGLAKFQHARKRKHVGTGGSGKAAVMGLLERHGEVRASVMPRVTRAALHAQVRQHVSPGSTVYTDGLTHYGGLNPDYVHKVIDHSEAYVQGKIHTNGIENFWSLFKRTVYGTFHSVEPVHLDRYLDDATFRFNTRKLGDGGRFASVVSRVGGRRVTYQRLIGNGDDRPVLFGKGAGSALAT